MKRKKIRRVDLQVCIFTMIIICVSIGCVYICAYTISYQDMLRSLNERVFSIYDYVEQTFDKTTFSEINSVDDQQNESYGKMKKLLKDVKSATGVMYLYTAKKDADGNFVYVVDGLNTDDPDFRNAGDKIEPEIWPEMEKALSDYEVLPADIKNTNWGKIFISYFPVHDAGKVVGVMGIEFDAREHYQAYEKVRRISLFIAVFACIIAGLIAVKLFKRISNPSYKDLANTDYLTGLKNRNAFELDMQNIIHSKQEQGYSVCSIDLNGLKQINDQLGHQKGDLYLRQTAEVIESVLLKDQVAYRIGGDEFLVVGTNASAKMIEAFFEKMEDKIRKEKKDKTLVLSLAYGYALFDENQDENILDTYKRADEMMYMDKQKKKKI